MKKQSILTILALSFVLGAAHIAVGQDLTIDDFTTGASNILIYQSGTRNLSTQTGDPNHLVGGTRTSNVNDSPNTLNQASTFQFRPDVQNNQSAFVQNGGFESGPRVDMGYGWGTPMRVDLSTYRNDPNGVIRLKFQGLTESLNFNIQLFTGGKWAQGGCNLPAYSGPFTVDLPLSKFIDTGIDFANINYMNFIFQNGSVIGAEVFAVSSIKASKTPQGGTISCHY